MHQFLHASVFFQRVCALFSTAVAADMHGDPGEQNMSLLQVINEL